MSHPRDGPRAPRGSQSPQPAGRAAGPRSVQGGPGATGDAHHPVLDPGAPHSFGRRGEKPLGAFAGHEGVVRAHRPATEPGFAAERPGLRRPLPRARPSNASGGSECRPLCHEQQLHPRGARGSTLEDRTRSLRWRSVSKAVLRKLPRPDHRATDLPATEGLESPVAEEGGRSFSSEPFPLRGTRAWRVTGLSPRVGPRSPCSSAEEVFRAPLRSRWECHTRALSSPSPRGCLGRQPPRERRAGSRSSMVGVRARGGFRTTRHDCVRALR